MKMKRHPDKHLHQQGILSPLPFSSLTELDDSQPGASPIYMPVEISNPQQEKKVREAEKRVLIKAILCVETFFNYSQIPPKC